MALAKANRLLKHKTPRNRKISFQLFRYVKIRKIVLSVLEEYFSRTNPLRNGEKQLFISYYKPHTAVSKSTISRGNKKV